MAIQCKACGKELNQSKDVHYISPITGQLVCVQCFHRLENEALAKKKKPG